jgi:hypothetical protein
MGIWNRLWLEQPWQDRATARSKSAANYFRARPELSQSVQPDDSFAIPQSEHVTLKVYDLLGREVATLVNEQRNAGSYDEIFDASKLASGMYIYKLQAGNFTASRKFVLMK